MSEEQKHDTDSDDDYNECILNPNNDRRKVICDAQNKADGIIQCIGCIESQYIPDSKTKATEKTHGTGTIIHIDTENNAYVLTAAHNIYVVEKQCPTCKTKTIKTACPGKCKIKSEKTGKLIEPTHVYFSRRGHGNSKTHSLGESVQQYQIEAYKVHEQYNTFPRAKSGYDISIIMFKCHDKKGIALYRQNCPKISLISDQRLGGKNCILHIFGYPFEKRKERYYREYYYLFGMGTSKLAAENKFEVATNDKTNQLYVVNKGIDTTPGQSGSAIYSYHGNDKGRYLIYGVHTGGSRIHKSNYGTFFDIDTIDWIAKILESDMGDLKNHMLNKFIVCQYALVMSRQLDTKKQLDELKQLKLEIAKLKQMQNKFKNASQKYFETLSEFDFVKTQSAKDSTIIPDVFNDDDTKSIDYEKIKEIEKQKHRKTHTSKISHRNLRTKFEGKKQKMNKLQEDEERDLNQEIEYFDDLNQSTRNINGFGAMHNSSMHETPLTNNNYSDSTRMDLGDATFNYGNGPGDHTHIGKQHSFGVNPFTVYKQNAGIGQSSKGTFINQQNNNESDNHSFNEYNYYQYADNHDQYQYADNQNQYGNDGTSIFDSKYSGSPIGVGGADNQNQYGYQKRQRGISASASQQVHLGPLIKNEVQQSADNNMKFGNQNQMNNQSISNNINNTQFGIINQLVTISDVNNMQRNNNFNNHNNNIFE